MFITITIIFPTLRRVFCQVDDELLPLRKAHYCLKRPAAEFARRKVFRVNKTAANAGQL